MTPEKSRPRGGRAYGPGKDAGRRRGSRAPIFRRLGTAHPATRWQQDANYVSVATGTMLGRRR